MSSGYIGEADIIIGADATGLAKEVQKQAQANLRAAGQQLGRELSDSIAKSASAAASKIPAAITKPLQSLPAAAQQVGAAISRSIGGAVDSAGKKVQALGQTARTAFGGAVAAAQALPGPMGAFANAAVRAFSQARQGLTNFTSGWKSAQVGLSSFSGKMGSLGTIARSASTAAGAALRNGISTAAKVTWSTLQTGATKAWAALKSGASKAASAAGAALKSGLGAAATGASAAIVGLVGTALGKGFARLNSLNQAEARLTGLGIAGEQLTSVMKSADDAVTGTAYSMADAANAAGMLASAGIGAGEGMDDAMKALVATTAASGREMSEITPIYTKIAAAGKVTGETMAQMLDAGINANGALQKSLGKTSAEITAMVSAGEVDFATFVEAINGDLSMLAAAMGGTLGGMASNVMSAMGRIGAEVQKPVFDALLIAMPAVLDLIKRLATAVKEFMAPLQGSLDAMGTKLKETFEGINPSVEGISKFTDSLGALLPIIGAVLGVSGSLLGSLPVIGPLFAGLSGPIGLAAGALAALVAVDPATLASGFANVGAYLEDNLPSMIEGALNLIEAGIGNLLQNLPTMLSGITNIVLTVLSSVTAALPTVIPMLVSAIGQLIPSLTQALLQALPLIIVGALQLFGGLVTGLVQSLPMLVETLVGAIPSLVDTLVAAIPLILDGALEMFSGILEALIVAVPLIVSALVESLPKIIESLVNAIPLVIESALSFFSGIITGLLDALPTIISSLIGAIPQILDAIISATPQIIDAGFSLFLGLIDALVQAVPEIITALIELIPTLFEAIVGAIPQIIEAGFTLFMGLIEGLWEAIPKIWEAITGDLLPGIWNAITGGGDKAEESGKGLGERAATGLSSTSTSFSTAGSTLGASATSGLGSASAGMSTAAAGLGTSATSALSAQTGGMQSAASALGAGAVTGLSGQTAATKTAATDLANAATVDVAAKVTETEAAGKKIATAFAAGITTGTEGARVAAAGLHSNAQAALASTVAFSTAGQNLSTGIATGISQGVPAVLTAIGVLSLQAQAALTMGLVAVLSRTFGSLWGSVIEPPLRSIVSGTAQSVAAIIQAWTTLASILRTTVSSSIIATLAALSAAVLTGPPTAFARAAAAIMTAWSGIQAAAKQPVRFVIDSVMNPFIGTMNQIPGVNVPRLSLPAGFARGGILPGMSRMSNGDDQLIMARRGEGMMVSEALRTPADRSAFLAANAAGRRGVGFASLLNGYARGGLVTPLPRGSFTVSQPWGNAGHNGIDLAAAMGTKVYAAAAGTVGLAGVVPMGGNEIYVQHENGLGTRYSHLSRFAVRAGQAVRKNQLIGHVGSTGMSTGPHLHYMVHNPGGGAGNYGNHVNPAPYMGIYGTEVDGFSDIIQGAANRLAGQFNTRFSTANMFNAAAGSIMTQGLKGAIVHAMGQLGTDDSTGDQGRTGRGRMRLYDSGGVIPHGGMGLNLSGKPEAVLTNAQWSMLEQLAAGVTGGALGSSSIGANITSGLAAGIRAGSGAVGAASAEMAQTTVDTSREVLDIHSPSKVFKGIGENIGAGLVQGLVKSKSDAKVAINDLIVSLKDANASYWADRAALESDVISLRAKINDSAAMKKMTAAQQKALKQEYAVAQSALKAHRSVSQKQLTILADVVRKQRDKLQQIAGQREQLAAQIEAAQTRLDDAMSARSSWVDSISSGITGQGNIAASRSASTMARTLEKRIAATQQFNTAITELRKMGLDDTSLEQLAQDFASTGSARAAQNLVTGGKDAVKTIADLQKQLSAEAGKVANNTGDMLYKAGIDAAAGLVKGLESQAAALEKTATKIADTITDRIKKVLGIKSPSRVLMELGEFAGEGFVMGLESMVAPAQTAMDDILNVGEPDWTARSGSGNRNSSATSGTQLVIAEGAIVVQAAQDPARTALEVADRIAEMVELGGI